MPVRSRKMKLDRVIAVRNRKTVFRDGDKCIKVFGPSYTKADVLNEALNQARIEETGLNIPEILELTRIDGKWAIVSRYIEGKTLQRIMDEEKENKSELMNEFVDLQMEIHAKSCPLLNRQKEAMNMQIIKCNLDATMRYDLHARLESMSGQNRICHGDFRPSNIIIDKENKPFILDWSHATQGNPSADAARTYLLFWMEGRISAADRYLEMFTKKSGITETEIRKWMPIVAAAESIRGNEKEREFLLSWVRDADNAR